MSFSGVYPTTDTITDTHRQLLRKLALYSEPRSTAMWSIMGTEQARVNGKGSLHEEGRYMLRSVAKNWKAGPVCCMSATPFDEGPEKMYAVINDLGTFVSTNKAALSRLFPKAEVQAIAGVGNGSV